jgi:hypothetical protein
LDPPDPYHRQFIFNARYLVVVNRNSDPVAIGKDFLASRRNQPAKEELERFGGTELQSSRS